MRLRVCTFNIHHGVGSDRRLDLDRTADVIAATGATVVGLQEVDRTLSRRSGWVDQAAWLGARLGMEVVHGATIDRDPAPGSPPDTPRRRYGNALLSAHPVLAWRAARLPGSANREARGLVDATVDVGGSVVRVLVTHLQNRSAGERWEQAAHLVEAVGNGPRTILLGDLNAGPDSREVRLLTSVLLDGWAVAGTGPGRTFPARRPIARIDHVLVSPDLRPVRADVPDTLASDHRPVVVELSGPDLVRPAEAAAGTLLPMGTSEATDGATASASETPAIEHRTTADLEAALDHFRSAPGEVGVVDMVVRRPAVGEREVLAVGELHPDHGLVGDNWAGRGSRRTEDGSAHPEMQLNVINARLSTFVAVDPERRSLAGDQLHLDLDLSADNLPPGTQLMLGTAVIEVTEIPHTGCDKFVARFGRDAMRFVNSPLGRELRLRGLNAKVVVAGTVRPGDEVRKIPAEVAPAAMS